MNRIFENQELALNDTLRKEYLEKYQAELREAQTRRGELTKVLQNSHISSGVDDLDRAEEIQAKEHVHAELDNLKFAVIPRLDRILDRLENKQWDGTCECCGASIVARLAVQPTIDCVPCKENKEKKAKNNPRFAYSDPGLQSLSYA